MQWKEGEGSINVEREYETALERTPKRWRRMRDLAHEGWGMKDHMKVGREASRLRTNLSLYVTEVTFS